MKRLILGVAVCSLLAACADKSPNVILDTDLGKIEIEVYPEIAPLSSADFLYYVDEGLYDGEGFYRVVRPDTDPLKLGMEIIQGGRLDSETVTPGIDHETTEMSGLTNGPGSVSIARDQPGTGSAAYFFINIANNDFLDYGGARNPDGQGYAVFGKVVKGIDVVRAIQAQEAKGVSANPVTEGQYLTAPVKIKSATRK